MAAQHDNLDELDDEALAGVAGAAISRLAERGTGSSFQALIALSSHVGVSLGVSARRVAERGSWSQVAEISGTSKQAAWSRWRGQ